MKYLLDVNLLLAIGNAGHADHAAAIAWVAALSGPEFFTCSITELGYVRISAATALQPGVVAAVAALEKWKNASGARLVADDLSVQRLPGWATTPAKTTDGHLIRLARANGAQLATFDRGIPGALIVR